jgi:hypothetical protein
MGRPGRCRPPAQAYLLGYKRYRESEFFPCDAGVGLAGLFATDGVKILKVGMFRRIVELTRDENLE